jgi:carbamoyl-phosphate synthase large subunit
MPKIFMDIALYNEFPIIKKKINPLPTNLLWIRGMDTEPKLMTDDELRSEIISL